MGKVVYLLGAGASYGRRGPQKMPFVLEEPKEFAEISRTDCECPDILEGLPIVSELPERMKYILSRVNDAMLRIGVENDTRNIIERLSKDLVWLQDSSANHATVDTYAKKLWLTGKKDEYNRLKRTLSAFFMLEQVFNKPDKRYDAFFASILGNDVKDLPSNVRILSWNYDMQIELAYSEYLDNSNLNDIEESLLFYQKTVDVNGYRLGNGFRVVKLNGSALMFEKYNRAIINLGIDDTYTESECIEKIASIAYSGEYDCALSFAWEETDDTFLSNIQKNISDADVLVVIGYSFPFFNRNMDTAIIKSLPTLKKIYIQDEKPEVVMESIDNFYPTKALRPQMIPVRSTWQFCLPPEL